MPPLGRSFFCSNLGGTEARPRKNLLALRWGGRTGPPHQLTHIGDQNDSRRPRVTTLASLAHVTHPKVFPV
jgi:hypothetical protein